MASVYKRGKQWMASFRNADGAWTARAAGTDKGEALRMASFWANEARLRREGLVDPKADGYKAADAVSIAEHIDAYENDLRARGRTSNHAGLTAGRVRLLAMAAKVERIADIRPAGINAALRDLKESRGLSEASASHYLRAMKLFTRWLLREGRTRDDALAGVSVKTAIAKSERKHQRRALSHDELAALLEYIPAALTRWGMTGADRAMLYRVAAGTGLRASELASLTPESFDLISAEPSATVAAAYSKRGKRNGRDDNQPMALELAQALAAWMTGRAKGKPVFNMPAVQHTAQMFRDDLQTARDGLAGWMRQAPTPAERRKRRKPRDFLAYRDASGRVIDFHALRHTYISWIVAGGAPVSVCQTLARHSTPVLTIGVYSHPTLADHRKALEGMPTMTTPTVKPERQALKATGTDDAQALPDAVGSAENALKTDGVFALRLASNGTSKSDATGGGEIAKTPMKTGANPTLAGGCEGQAGAGFEPATNGFAIRPIRPLWHPAGAVSLYRTVREK